MGRRVPGRGGRRGGRPYRRHRPSRSRRSSRTSSPTPRSPSSPREASTRRICLRIFARGPPARSSRRASSPAATATCTRTSSRCTSARDDQDVTLITSCVKGMNARAVRNTFTEALAAGQALPAPLEGLVLRQGRLLRAPEGLHRVPRDGRLPVPASDYQRELLHHRRPPGRRHQGRHGERLFYTGQSVTRIPEQSIAELKSVQELVSDIEDGLARWEQLHGSLSCLPYGGHRTGSPGSRNRSRCGDGAAGIATS